MILQTLVALDYAIEPKLYDILTTRVLTRHVTLSLEPIKFL